MFNYQDQKYYDYACILSVAAQAAIDNAKKTFSIDITSEIKRIKKDMDIKTNGYPRFWKCIHPEYQGYINNNLKCPMNEVAQFRLQNSRGTQAISNEEFFVKHELTENRKKCKRVENLIQKYSLELLDYNSSEERDFEEYLLIRQDFDKLISDIRQTYISNNYLGLMSWLIDRALKVTKDAQRTADQTKTLLNKNRSLLMKTLYSVSPKQFLQCFVPKMAR